MPVNLPNLDKPVVRTEMSTEEIVTEENNIEEENENDEKYVQFFSSEYIKEIQIKVDNWILEELYLEVDCSFVKMAIQIQIPQHHLNYFFNTILDKKFTDWRNNLRIEFSKSLLEKDITKEITIEALALKSGFASQTTFNRAFKNYLGVTPSQFIKLKS
jgi:AraC-like DNA-binding protein